VIEVRKADELVRLFSLKLSTELVKLEDLYGRVLSKEIRATRMQPPFDRVTMDGIAIQFDQLLGKKFNICGIQKAGSPPLFLEDNNHALEVMTGAVLPMNSDTVIPYEHLVINDGRAQIRPGIDIEQGQNIHFEGSDYLAGKILFEAGHRINSASLAVIASQGITHAEVLKYPQIAIVSTGDELVESGKPCEPWQIWRSNSIAIQAELRAFGVPEKNIKMVHLVDDKNLIFSTLAELLNHCDTFIISGGVSMGKYDFVQSVMNDLGVEEVFYKVQQRPGKPMFFGKNKDSKIVFGLPGNPVSALICMRRYVIQSLCYSFKMSRDSRLVKLSEDIVFKKDLTLFKAVNIENQADGSKVARAIDSNGSGDFYSLGLGDGFIELPAEQNVHKAGALFPFYSWSGLNL